MATNPELNDGFIDRRVNKKPVRHYKFGRSKNRAPTGDSNRAVGTDGLLLAQEAHDLVRKDPHVESALNSWEANTVSTGIQPYPVWDNEEKEQEVKELWRRSQAELDADGMLSFYAMQALAARSVVESGEVFIRKRVRRLSDGLIVPVQYQMLEAEMLPLDLNTTGENGHTVEMGIEKDRIGRRVAYHFHAEHPGKSITQRAGRLRQTVVVPAQQIYHIGKVKRPGQLRFVSHLAPAVEGLKIINDAGVAMAERIRTSSLFTGYVSKKVDELSADVYSKEDEEEGVDDSSRFGEGEPDETGQAITQEIEAGTIVYLEDGETIFFPDLPDVGSNYLPFVESYQRAFAASIGLTFEGVTGNLTKTNFSSARVGALEMRRRVGQFVTFCLIDQFCKKVWKDWLTEAVLSGAISLPGFHRDPWPYYNVQWRPPGWEFVNPVDEAQAALISIRGGFDSRSNVALTRGLEPESVDRQNNSDQTRAKQLHLFYDSDPKHELQNKEVVQGESAREKEQMDKDDEAEEDDD